MSAWPVRVQYTEAGDRRRTLRLGKIPKRTAEGIKTRVEYLLTAKMSKQAVDPETAQWVAGIDDVLHGKLAKLGLVSHRESATLGAFVDAYIAGRCDAKPNTILHLKRSREDLVGFLGADKLMRDVTAGDADDFRLHLLNRGLAENTVRRRCGRAKQYFRAAFRKGLVADNPFADLKTTIQANESRYYFVSREEAAAVLEACPDAEWRLLFALARFGGLRCPSEHLALTWDCVDWERNRIRILSPKTERHSGKESRIIPLFPELRPYLEAAFDLAPEGTTHVIRRYRDKNSNLRTQLCRIIDRAGLEPWPKLFQNLRSTRETELAETFPIHVVCEWIGNSQPVAAKHYLQTTPEHFERAIQGDEKATQNPTQTVQDEVCQGGNKKHETPGKSAMDNPGLWCTSVKAPPARLELATRRLTAACSTN